MTLLEAADLLCKVYTRDDDKVDFTVQMPNYFPIEYDRVDYIKAWEVLRNFVKEPEKKNVE